MPQQKEKQSFGVGKSSYVVPPARINYCEPKEPGSYSGLAHKDDIYTIPCKWIAANASRFYFTNKQILEAAQPDFVDPYPESYCRIWVVYFLIRNSEIVYVGQSSCFSERLEQHREGGKDFDRISWVEVPALFINDIEAYYIWRCNPIMNNKWPRYGYFGKAARTLDEKCGEKRNQGEDD